MSGVRSIAGRGAESGWAARVTSVERVQGSAERGLARAASLCVRHQRHMSRPTKPNGTGARGNSYHDQEHVNEYGHGGCRSVWYRPRHEPAD